MEKLRPVFNGKPLNCPSAPGDSNRLACYLSVTIYWSTITHSNSEGESRASIVYNDTTALSLESSDGEVWLQFKRHYLIRGDGIVLPINETHRLKLSISTPMPPETRDLILSIPDYDVTRWNWSRDLLQASIIGGVIAALIAGSYYTIKRVRGAGGG